MSGVFLVELMNSGVRERGDGKKICLGGFQPALEYAFK